MQSLLQQISKFKSFHIALDEPCLGGRCSWAHVVSLSSESSTLLPDQRLAPSAFVIDVFHL